MRRILRKGASLLVCLLQVLHSKFRGRNFFEKGKCKPYFLKGRKINFSPLNEGQKGNFNPSRTKKEKEKEKEKEGRPNKGMDAWPSQKEPHSLPLPHSTSP